MVEWLNHDLVFLHPYIHYKNGSHIGQVYDDLAYVKCRRVHMGSLGAALEELTYFP